MTCTYNAAQALIEGIPSPPRFRTPGTTPQRRFPLRYVNGADYFECLNGDEFTGASFPGTC
jgi:hypothetical protein